MKVSSATASRDIPAVKLCSRHYCKAYASPKRKRFNSQIHAARKGSVTLRCIRAVIV